MADEPDIRIEVTRADTGPDLVLNLTDGETHISVQMTPELSAVLAGGISVLLAQVAAEVTAELSKWVNTG